MCQAVVMAHSLPRPIPDQTIDNPLDDQLGYQLRRASSLMFSDLTRKLHDLDLRPSDAATLVLIATNPGITLSAIGRVLGIHRANMTPIAAMLSRRHLVERSRADGRSQGLALTAAGARMFEEVSGRIAAHEAPFLQRLTPSERGTLMALLQKVWAD
jgi:DNA-binding MarR family transcriptional regulator